MNRGRVYIAGCFPMQPVVSSGNFNVNTKFLVGVIFDHKKYYKNYILLFITAVYALCL